MNRKPYIRLMEEAQYFIERSQGVRAPLNIEDRQALLDEFFDFHNQEVEEIVAFMIYTEMMNTDGVVYIDDVAYNPTPVFLEVAKVLTVQHLRDSFGHDELANVVAKNIDTMTPDEQKAVYAVMMKEGCHTCEDTSCSVKPVYLKLNSQFGRRVFLA
jgi:hypothetical protein